MAKVKVKLQRICASVVEGDRQRVPFMEALRAARKQPVSARTFYWLNKISAVLEKEFADYEEARIKLVMTLGTPTDHGYTVPAAQLAEFGRQLAELDHEVELPLDEGVKLDLPATGTADDWFPLMTALDIFAEPK